ncbi:MAG: SUMF1/EgtB/PvdO family nonheme iron enzyme [Candidatus Hydrogenedentes bacterium]|nr:SUMF1/EgtB/PvdO family nonheme iron enzyme [Candidatus Hydrogenedentota bacterium]
MRFFGCYTFACLGLCLLCGAASAAERGSGGMTAPASPAPQKWAVIIGVGNYDDVTISDLPSAVNDARALRDRLVAMEQGFPAANVLLLTDGEDDMHAPTRENMMKFLSSTLSMPGEDDTVLVYFAGHGVMADDQLYLLLRDATTEDVAFSGFAFAELKALLENVPAKKKILILDACHAGAGRGLGDKLSKEALAEIESASSGTVTLTSCGEQEQSYDMSETGHGAFTYFLLEALTGKADKDADNLISAHEAAYYTWEQTRRWAADQGFQQTPQRTESVSGEIILARPYTPAADASSARIEQPTPQPPSAIGVPFLEEWPVLRGAAEWLRQVPSEALTAAIAGLAFLGSATVWVWRSRRRRAFAKAYGASAPYEEEVLPPPPPPPLMEGGLQVVVNVPEARVKINGKLAGATRLKAPLCLPNLVAGEYLVEVDAPGRQPQAQRVNIPPKTWVNAGFILRTVGDTPKPSKRAPRRKKRRRWPGYAAATVVALLLGAAGYVGWNEMQRAQIQSRELPPMDLDAEPRTGLTRTLDLGNGVTLELAGISAGRFVMGSPEDEEQRVVAETQHQVTLTDSFWMGKYEVTQAQWERVMGANPSFFKGDRKQPVETVSWEDCQEFLRRLNGRVSGAFFRLPTEAEWEFACRAGTSTPFHFGETVSTDQANYNGHATYGRGRKGEYRRKTTPAGAFPANAWGLCDMHGNVWEWCQDWYGEYPESSVTDPHGARGGEHRVVRGGCCADGPAACRSANRNRGLPTDRKANVGFRVVAVSAR